MASIGRPGSLKLRSKISLSVIITVTLVFTAVIAYVSYSSSNRTRADAEALAVSTVNEVGNTISKIVDENINVLHSVAAIIEHMDRTNPAARKTVSDILVANMEHAPEILSLWIAFEPNGFDSRDAEFAKSGGYDKTGQFIIGYLNSGGKIERVYDVTSDFINDPNEGGFYQEPLKTGKQIIQQPAPYTYPNGHTVFMTTISVPIELNGKRVGVVGLDFDFESMQKLMDGLHAISDGTNFRVFFNDGTIIHSSAKDTIGKNFLDVTVDKSTAGPVMEAIKGG